MELHGLHIIANTQSARASSTFHAFDPSTGASLEPAFHEATTEEIDFAAQAAHDAFEAFRQTTPEQRAAFLEAIADETLALGDALLDRASAETGHPRARCEAERMRSVNQARLFASFVREGSWVDARIDTAEPDRQPLPKPDVRSLMQPVGPVAVFGASNFPIAISVLGSDTVSAFAAGCPVVVKAHPAHPGTCEIASAAIVAAAVKTGMPEGVFSLVHGKEHACGIELVKHPRIMAAAFTGSLAGGRALFDVANARPRPIPFFAEMGSVNPVFVLPGALAENGEAIARDFVASLTTGVGQFCTNPGLVFGLDSPEWRHFRDMAASHVRSWAPQTMLHAGIHRAYQYGIEERRGRDALALVAESDGEPRPERSEAAGFLFETDAAGLAENPSLYEELFGPVSTLVKCGAPGDLERFAEQLDGSLTASVHGTPDDLKKYSGLLSVLERKAGRLIFNGYPVGLEVCHAMHHGGPYPATCHSHFTSIGTRCIQRFVRPVCYQSWPQEALPAELRDDNPRGIWRLVDGERTRESL